jgi:hypothetical protein
LEPEHRREELLPPLKSDRIRLSPLAVCDPFSPPQVRKVDSPCRLDHVGAYGLANGAPWTEFQPSLIGGHGALRRSASPAPSQ